MKVFQLINELNGFDDDAEVGVLCVSHDDVWIHTKIGIEVKGFGAAAEIAIIRTDDASACFQAPGATI